MSTRGSTFADDPADHDWTPTPKPWCPAHCAGHDDCAEAPVIGANIVLGQE